MSAPSSTRKKQKIAVPSSPLGLNRIEAKEADPSPRETALTNALQIALQAEDAHRLDLAKRLHRDVAGNLVACTALSEMVKSMKGSQDTLPPSIVTTLSRIDSALRDTLQLVRSLAEEQFPPVLNAFGLNTALQQLVKKMAAGFNGALLLHVGEGELALDATKRLSLFRILEMIIQRCVAHSRATVIEISCAASNGCLECVVDHDGQPEIWTYGSGEQELAIVHARCASLGCNLQTTTSPTSHIPRIMLVVPCRTKSV